MKKLVTGASKLGIEINAGQVQQLELYYQELMLNGYVGRAHLTHVWEFYEVTDSSFNIAELNSELLVGEKVYNTVRNHPATLRLKEFLECYKQNDRKEVLCH